MGTPVPPPVPPLQQVAAVVRTAYLDSSVLVKRYVREPGHDSMLTILSHPDYEGGLFVSQSALVEVMATLNKAWRAGRLTDRKRRSASEHFQEHFRTRFWVLPVRDEEIRTTLELLERHRERNLGPEDALHIASAMEAKRILKDARPHLEETFKLPGPFEDLTFMSSDAAQKKVARFENFHVFDPAEEKIRRLLPNHPD